MINRLLIISLSIIITASGCQKQEESAGKKGPDPSKIILATIDDEQVTLEDYQRTMHQLYNTNAQLQQTSEGKNKLTKLQKNLVDELINRRIMLKCAQKLNLAVTDAEINSETQKISNDYLERPFEQTLQQEGLTLNQWKRFVRQELLIKKLIAQEIESKITIKDSEIKAYYKENIKDFNRPDRVKVRQIVVENEDEAESIHKKLRKGKDFSALARANSLSPEAAKGGELPYFARGEMPSEFDEIAFNLRNKGEISAVFKTGYGYHIFQLMDYQKSRQFSLKDSRKSITEKLRLKKVEENFSGWINSLKADSKIKINPYFTKEIQ